MGMSVSATGREVRSLRIRRANRTVKAGAVDFIVSTKETGTCSNAMRPRTTVSPRRRPTMDMSRMKVLFVVLASGFVLIVSEDCCRLYSIDFRLFHRKTDCISSGNNNSANRDI